MHRDAGFFDGLVQIFDESCAAAVGFDRHVAKEFALAVDHCRLTAPVWHEFHALFAQPDHRRQALVDQILRQIGIGAVGGELVDLVEEFLARVGAEIGLCDFLFGDFRDFQQVFHGFKGEAHHAAGETAVAATFVFGCGFENGDFGALVMGRQGGAHGGVALADDDHIKFGHF